MFPKTSFVSWFSKTPATASLSFCIPTATTPTLAPSPLCPEAATPHPSARLSSRPGPGKAHTTQRLHLHQDLPPCNLTFTDLCSLSLRTFCSGQTGLVHSWGHHSIIFSCLNPPTPRVCFGSYCLCSHWGQYPAMPPEEGAVVTAVTVPTMTPIWAGNKVSFL